MMSLLLLAAISNNHPDRIQDFERYRFTHEQAICLVSIVDDMVKKYNCEEYYSSVATIKFCIKNEEMQKEWEDQAQSRCGTTTADH